MASLIPKTGVLFNHAAVAPSPCKDYCQLIVKQDEVIFRWWKVTLRANAKATPGEKIESLEDFRYDERLHSEITRVFGNRMLHYIRRLADGHIDYLPRLPKQLIFRIIRFLDLEDVARLAQTSKQFRDLCNSDELWQLIYKDHSESLINDELRSLAEAIGWKKLFFTNKLQLQVQLRRQARKRIESLGSVTDSDRSSSASHHTAASDQAFITTDPDSIASTQDPDDVSISLDP